MHWWYRDQMPFPRPTTIARRMGVTVRTVQRALLGLQALGLLTKTTGPDGDTHLDPTPLCPASRGVARKPTKITWREPEV